MKIGMICYPTFGGSGVLATELGKALANKGHEVHFITYKRPVRLDEFHPNTHYHEVFAEDYPVFDFLPYESALTSAIVEVATKAKLDVLHVHYAIPHASAAIFAHHILKHMGILLPVVTTLHGTDITLVGREASYEPVVTYSINNSHGVTAVSEYLRQATYDNFAVDRDIAVIHNFVDIGRFSCKAGDNNYKHVLSQDGAKKIVMHLSNFRPVKRVGDVLEMYIRLRERIPARMVFIGDGPDCQKLERRVRDLSLEDEVLFLGKQSRVEELLSAGDLFVLPSEHESFGLSALEAMASGMPVLASNAGGLPEVITEGESGKLAPVGDVGAMVEAAYDILKDEDQLSQYRCGALNRAQHFTVQRILPEYENAYLRAIEVVKQTSSASA